MSAWYNKSMAFPGNYNFNYYEGDTYQFNIYPKNADGSAFSLNDYSASFTIATSRGPSPDSSVIATATVSDNNTFVTATILPSVGRNLSSGTSYVYDVQISNGVDAVYTLLTGNITVTADVTGA